MPSERKNIKQRNYLSLPFIIGRRKTDNREKEERTVS
jgi:hypothetical protein